MWSVSECSVRSDPIDQRDENDDDNNNDNDDGDASQPRLFNRIPRPNLLDRRSASCLQAHIAGHASGQILRQPARRKVKWKKWSKSSAPQAEIIIRQQINKERQKKKNPIKKIQIANCVIAIRGWWAAACCGCLLWWVANLPKRSDLIQCARAISRRRSQPSQCATLCGINCSKANPNRRKISPLPVVVAVAMDLPRRKRRRRRRWRHRRWIWYRSTTTKRISTFDGTTARIAKVETGTRSGSRCVVFRCGSPSFPMRSKVSVYGGVVANMNWSCMPERWTFLLGKTRSRLVRPTRGLHLGRLNQVCWNFTFVLSCFIYRFFF